MKKLLRTLGLLGLVVGACRLTAMEGSLAENQKLHVEGEVLSVSRLPSPQQIDYPNCNYSATIALNTVPAQKMVVVFPGIRASKVVSSNDVAVGRKLKLTLVLEDALTEDEKSIQISDENTDFDLPYYYSEAAKPIESFSAPAPLRIASHVRENHAEAFVLSPKDEKIRDEYIKSEKERLNKIITEYNEKDKDDFINKIAYLAKAEKDSYPFVLLPIPDKKSKVFPILYSPGTFGHLKRTLSPRDISSIATVIAHIRDYFHERGTLLIVVPIPEYHESFLGLLVPSVPELSTYSINRIKLMEKLLDDKIETIDLEPMISAGRAEEHYFYGTLKDDSHMTNYGYNRMAEYIAAHMNRYDYFKNLSLNDYSVKYEIKRHDTVYRGVEYLPYFDLTVSAADKKKDPLFKDSPYVVIGDSFTRDFLRPALANAFKSRLNVISNSSAGPRMPRIIQTRQNSFSRNMKVCFFLFHASYINDNQWDDFYSNMPGLHLDPNEVLNNIMILDDNKDKIKVGFKAIKIAESDNIHKIAYTFSLNVKKYLSDSERYKIQFHLKTNGVVQYTLSHKSRCRFGCDNQGNDVLEFEFLKRELECSPEFKMETEILWNKNNSIAIKITDVKLIPQ